MNRILLLSIYAVVAMLLIVGCAKKDNLFLTNDNGSSLKVVGTTKISSFKIQLQDEEGNHTLDSLFVELISQTNGNTFNFNAKAILSAKELHCEMHIPIETTLNDSDYRMRFKTNNQMSALTNRSYLLTVRDEMVYATLSESYEYTYLPGKGTENDPYRIDSSDKFHKFIYHLSEDKNKGAGLYFRQEADIEGPTDKGASGTGYIGGEEFAGNYNGQGYTFSFTYSGDKSNNKYQNVGMFSILRDGARVSNLRLDATIHGANKYVGALAGQTEGSVTLKLITLNKGGIYDAGNCVGGLIGRASGTPNSNDCLTMEFINFKYLIDAQDSVGGVVGKVSNVNIVFNEIKSSGFQAITGFNFVGGLIGGIEADAISIVQTSLTHTVSEEDKDIPLLEAATSYCGGLIGGAMLNTSLLLQSIEIDMPIGKKDNGKMVGGLIGQLRFNEAEHLEFKDCHVNESSYIKGNEFVGGFVGDLYGTEKSPLTKLKFSGTQNSIFSSVTGNGAQVGGVFGSLNMVSINPESIVKVESTVTSGTSSNSVGGFSGRIWNSEIAITPQYQFSPTMTVSGAKYVGGFAGSTTASSFVGSTVIDLPINGSELIAIPSADSFGTPVFSGKINSVDNFVTSGNDAGGFIGYSKKDKEIRGILVAPTVFGNASIGGLIGKVENTPVTHCVSNGDIIQGSNNVGGVIGRLNSPGMEYHYLANYTSVSATSENTGGIIGEAENYSRILKCYNAATVNGTGSIGGIVGLTDGNSNRQILECANFNTITGINKYDWSRGAGGIVGTASTTKSNANTVQITRCSNHGDVVSLGNKYKGIGGILGVGGNDPEGASNNDNRIYISYSTNTASISGVLNANEHIGGIVGYFEEGNYSTGSKTMRVSDCYNAGSIPTNSKSDNGGIIGSVSNYTAIYNSLNIGYVYYGNGCVGTHVDWSDIEEDHKYLYTIKGRNSHENKIWWDTKIDETKNSTLSYYKGFDDDIWILSPSINKGFPYLINCYWQFVSAAPQ